MHRPEIGPAVDYKAAMTSIVYLYKMEIDLLESVAKGFSSFTLKSNREKEDFYKKTIAFNRVALWFYETSVLKGSPGADKQTPFNRLYTIKKYIEDDMIDLMDRPRNVDPARVSIIRENTAKTASHIEELIALVQNDAVKARGEHDRALESLLSFANFFVLTVAEIEEVYAYAVIGKDALADNYRLLGARSNAALENFRRSDDVLSNSEMLETYNQIIAAKIDFESIAGKIRNARGKVSLPDAKEFARFADSAISNMDKMMDLLIVHAGEKAFVPREKQGE